MPAGEPPHPVQLALIQVVQGGQRPGQLHRLGPGQRTQLPERQRPLRAAGRVNRYRQVTSSREAPGVGHPGGQQPGQRLIGDRPPGVVGAQVVFEVVQHHQHRHPAQHMLAQHRQPVRPAQVRPGRHVQSPDDAAACARGPAAPRRTVVITAPSRASRVSGPARLTRTRPGSRVADAGR